MFVQNSVLLVDWWTTVPSQKTLYTRLKASIPSPIARCVFPVPGEPAKMTFCPSFTNSSIFKWGSICLACSGEVSSTKSSNRFFCGKFAARIRFYFARTKRSLCSWRSTWSNTSIASSGFLNDVSSWTLWRILGNRNSLLNSTNRCFFIHSASPLPPVAERDLYKLSNCVPIDQ